MASAPAQGPTEGRGTTSPRGSIRVKAGGDIPSPRGSTQGSAGNAPRQNTATSSPSPSLLLSPHDALHQRMMGAKESSQLPAYGPVPSNLSNQELDALPTRIEYLYEEFKDASDETPLIFRCAELVDKPLTKFDFLDQGLDTSAAGDRPRFQLRHRAATLMFEVVDLLQLIIDEMSKLTSARKTYQVDPKGVIRDAFLRGRDSIKDIVWAHALLRLRVANGAKTVEKLWNKNKGYEALSPATTPPGPGFPVPPGEEGFQEAAEEVFREAAQAPEEEADFSHREVVFQAQEGEVIYHPDHQEGRHPEIDISSLPDWNGDERTALTYFAEVQNSGGTIAQSMGIYLWQRLTKGTAIMTWYVVLPPAWKAIMRGHYLNYLYVIKTYWLGDEWVNRMHDQYKEMRFRGRGREHELPRDFIQARLLLLRAETGRLTMGYTNAN
ncbi:hypothetical protein C8R47DRAFT_1244419 [Mycena vitilis]|nr:hypothetical protein C8R47DRAFT_1244419 [Mycena vitilis]